MSLISESLEISNIKIYFYYICKYRLQLIFNIFHKLDFYAIKLYFISKIKALFRRNDKIKYKLHLSIYFTLGYKIN